MSPFGVEYGRVRVTNIGRTALSVENISFEVRRRYRWTPRRRRATLQPMQFMHKDADPKQHRLDPSDPIRLEDTGPLETPVGRWHWGYLFSRALTIGGGTSVRL
jgi:hypothetical protein